MGVDNSVHLYSEPQFQEGQARSPLSRIDALHTFLQQEGAITTPFITAYEAIKDTLFGLTGNDLVDTAQGLGIPADQATNKAVINAFCEYMFPELSKRTLDDHTEYLQTLENRTLDHFAEHGVQAFSTGSFALKGGRPSTLFSDYDVLVTPEDTRLGYQGFQQAIDTLPQAGIYGFPGDLNGGLGGARLVLEAGNAGFGFIRAMTDEGVTVELFIVGQNSLPAVSRVGGRIPKLQHTAQGLLQVRSLRAPHELTIVSQPEPHDNSFVSWPALQKGSGEVEHGLAFFEALVAMIDPKRGQGEALLQAREQTLETGIRLLQHYNPSMNGELPDSMLHVVGYAGKPELTPQRHAEFVQDIERIREHITPLTTAPKTEFAFPGE